MVRALVLVGVWSVVCGSQAFFLTPTAWRSTCGVVDGWSSSLSSSSCQRNKRRGMSGYPTNGRRGAAGGPLTMKKKKVKNFLEEVSEELASNAVALECPRTGRKLVCYAERVAVVDGRRYLVAFPKDPAVAIAFDEDGEVSPVPNDDLIMDDLFPLAEACVADLGPGVTLLRTPTTLTVQGLDELVEEAKDEEGSGDEDEGEDEEDQDATTIELDGKGQGGGEGEDDEDADEVELLGEFLLEGEEFLIVRFLEPVLILAKEQSPGKYVLIDEEEEQDAIPLVDELLSGVTTP